VRCPSLSELPPAPAGKTGWPWTEETGQLADRMADGQPWPRASVVTPSYNQAQFIEEAIRSVLLQGYPDLEYAIMDGGSTDQSLEIIHRYERWLAYWVSEPDRGQTHAINKGWARATGDILSYLNTDDCYLPGALPAAARTFSAEPGAGMVYASAIVVNEVGKALRMWEARPFALKSMLTVGNCVPQPAAFYSTSALNRVGYLNELWHMIMDYELAIRLGLRLPTVCLSKTVARFRDHPQSKTQMKFEATASELLAFVSTFCTDQVPYRELQTIKRTARSRVHYELALAYLARAQRQGSKAFAQLGESILLDPPFAFRRPVQTVYIIKELLLAHLETLVKQVPVVLKRTR
jgi:glycosyltransferase involved in cell wall biosynthesis